MKNKKIFFIVAFIALILNLIWEFSHYPLYIDLSGIPEYTHLVIASFADMFILLGIFCVVSLKSRGFGWINSPSKFDYFLIILLGLIVAILIEIVNLNLGRWMYVPTMPTIFKVGVSPLVQLALTGISSLVVLKYIVLRKNERAN